MTSAPLHHGSPSVRLNPLPPPSTPISLSDLHALQAPLLKLSPDTSCLPLSVSSLLPRLHFIATGNSLLSYLLLTYSFILAKHFSEPPSSSSPSPSFLLSSWFPKKAPEASVIQRLTFLCFI
ncbi:hypothetical protein PBY51_015432 [Eleginops maclovinus]|uniref:Uncharacterized protein n=1 Tax=Eleginops maclovinus TaxID=56733 RepID=A0AAN7X4V6_ELEMC|nr:hypothetical protein PBY51_015432 [Eleginops maclovinus]